MNTTTPLSVRHGHSRKLASLLLLGAVLTSALAAAPTVAELMELGVYSEETKGDIDAALLLYQQVVADANAGQALAAQARPVNLNEQLENMLRILRRLLGEHIAIETALAPALPPVLADPGMLEQIVMNLCVNARDAMPAGGTIHLSTSRVALTEAARPAHPEGRPGTFLRLTVRDTGCGMDDSTRSHLFEPFFTTKDTGKGTGLGLATVFAIVKQHEGWIEVDSTVGQGTTFALYLPCAPATATTADTAAAVASTHGTETVLLVEDDAISRQTVGLALRRDGYHVLEADSAVTARTVWAQHRATIAALITDVVMPGGHNGLELAHALRADNPQLSVVIISGYSADATHRQPAVPHATYLSKPFDYETLSAAIRASLARRPDRVAAPPGAAM